MSEELGVAVIGCGRVAPNHFDAFSQLSDVDIRWACDPVRERAAALAEKYGVAAVATDAAEVFADPAVAAVSLAVPHHLHGPLARAAVEAGKHVLIEKPFVLHEEEAVELLAAARHAGVVVMPIVQHRFDAPIRLVEDLLHSGVLGRLVMVRAHLECVRPPEYYTDSDWRGRWLTEGGSVVMNQAFHVVDLLLHLGGAVAGGRAAMATTAPPQVMETEDSFVATLRFENGALGSLTVTGASGAQWRSAIELFGTDGVVAFDIAYPNTLHRLELKSRRAQKEWRDRIAASIQALPLAPGTDYYGISHRDQAAAFVHAIRTDEWRGATPDDAVSTLRLIRSLYADAGAPQPVRAKEVRA